MSTIQEKKALLSAQSDFGANTQEFVHGSNSFVFISKWVSIEKNNMPSSHVLIISQWWCYMNDVQSSGRKLYFLRTDTRMFSEFTGGNFRNHLLASVDGES